MKKPITMLCAGLLALGLAACGPKHTADTAGKIGTGSQSTVVNPDAATAGTNLSNATMPGGPGTGVSADPSSTASGSKENTAGAK